MKISNQENWQSWQENNQDPYGFAIIKYAEQWANLMEKEIESGFQLEEIAKETGHEADTEGITGFMYGAAVSVLHSCWVHGERLRRWHNLDVQIGDEGERANEEDSVLNPALLCLGASSNGNA